jgi:hypothetical protein
MKTDGINGWENHFRKNGKVIYESFQNVIQRRD